MDDSDKNLINNYLEKGKFLGYCIRKILLTHLNIYKKTDRDSYINKRIQLPGSLLLELYRELWEQFIKKILKNIEIEFRLNYSKSIRNDIETD